MSGRSRSTGISLRRSGLSRLVSLGITMATTIVSSRFLIHAVGLSGFGVIGAFATVGMFMAFMDRGVAGGYMVEIPLLRPADRASLVPELLAAGSRRVRAGVIAGSLFALAAVALQAPRRLLDLPPGVSTGDLLLGFAVVMALFIVALPIGVHVRTLDALGRADLSARNGAVGALASLAYLVPASYGPHRFVFLAAQPALATLFANFLCWRAVRQRFPERRPSTTAVATALARTSRNMLGVQLSSAVAFNTDMLLVAVFVNTSAAGTFSLYSRVYGGMFAVIHSLLWPLWSLLGSALGEGDTDEGARLINMTITRLLPGTFAFLAVGAAVAPTVVRIISSRTVVDPPNLNLLFAIWIGCSVTHTALSLIVGASGNSAPLAAIHIRMAALNLALSLVLVGTVGITGVLVGSIVATVLLAIIPEAWLVLRLLNGPFDRTDLGAAKPPNTIISSLADHAPEKVRAR